MQSRILIVDDHPGICLLLSEVFTYENFHVFTAETGQEALETLASHSVDIIILDHQLPILNGIEVIQHLEALNNEIPILLMSGAVDKIKKEANQYRSVKKVISKPFDLEDIQLYVQEALLSSNKR